VHVAQSGENGVDRSSVLGGGQSALDRSSIANSVTCSSCQPCKAGMNEPLTDRYT
jgi:hypothetical protein